MLTKIFISFTIITLCVQNQNCKVLPKTDRFVTYIFNKYGSHGVISFEGLEHLMHSLGLGGLEFDYAHTIKEHWPINFVPPEIVIEDEIETNIDNAVNKARMLDTLPQHSNIEASKHNVKENTRKEVIFDNNIYQNAFKEMHDPKHQHPRHHDHGSFQGTCLSPSSIIHLLFSNYIEEQKNINYKDQNITNKKRRSPIQQVDETTTKNEWNMHGYSHESKDDQVQKHIFSTVKITPELFISMCPALLVQIDQGACSDVTKVEMGKHDKAFTLAWIYSSISILIISMCGLAGVAIVPLMKSVAYQEILRFLVALAVGTLCGDALMHLLPHSLTPHLEHGHDTMSLFKNGNVNDESVWLCLCAFLCALFMYSLETLLSLLDSNRNHQHHHGHQMINKSSIEADVTMEVVQMCDKELNKMLKESNVQKKFKLTPAALMVVLGDGLHNLTDGLAIGSAFAIDPVTGMATALAVLCHELPHELGDFALLLQTGVTIKRAIFLNIFSSILSVVGMIAGLSVAGVHTSCVRWIYSGTAGTFLYIALADLVPEMNRNTGPHKLKSCAIQISGIFVGGLIMLIIALNEDHLRILFQ